MSALSHPIFRTPQDNLRVWEFARTYYKSMEEIEGLLSKNSYKNIKGR